VNVVRDELTWNIQVGYINHLDMYYRLTAQETFGLLVQPSPENMKKLEGDILRSKFDSENQKVNPSQCISSGLTTLTTN
jgi:hypothetical protein